MQGLKPWVETVEGLGAERDLGLGLNPKPCSSGQVRDPTLPFGSPFFVVWALFSERCISLPLSVPVSLEYHLLVSPLRCV